MYDRTAPQSKHILSDATGAGAATLPMAHVRQSMFDGHALPPLRTSLRCLLAFAPLLHQGFIGMNTAAAPSRARGTALPHRTVSTRRRRELDHPTNGQGDGLSAWAPQCVALPIPLARTVRNIRPLPHRPGLADNGQRRAPL